MDGVFLTRKIWQSAASPHKSGLAAWTARILHTLTLLGGPGIFLLAFLDSSVLSFPVVTDLLIMKEAISSPARMIYFAAMAVTGSLSGCILLYWLAWRGGEAFYHRLSRTSSEHLRRWMERNAFLCIFAASLLPPPMPFKPFIILAGILEVRARTFATAVITGRGVRYLTEGWLAVHYGARSIHFVLTHKWEFAGIALAVAALLALASRLISRVLAPA
jgi:membrane protein YqaA with SNARE-associated domain